MQVSVRAARRVVEVNADLGPGGGRFRYGSGLFVGGHSVLTAAHVVAGAVAVKVRGADKRSLPATLQTALIGVPDAEGLDLALLEVPQSEAFEPIRVALVSRDVDITVTIDGCAAVGYPNFAELERGDTVVRETRQIVGRIAPLSSQVARLLSLQVTDMPAASPPLPGDGTPLSASPWSGMSGAAVFAPDPLGGDELLIGVVEAHSPRRGASDVSVLPLDCLLRQDSGLDNASAWWAALGVTDIGRLPQLPVRGDAARLSLLGAHLRSLRDGARRLPYRTLPLPSADLPDLYVETLLRERPAEPDAPAVKLADEQPPATDTLVSLQDALGVHDHLVIEGGPGIGKSATLQHLAWVMADTLLAGFRSDALVPILVSAKGLASWEAEAGRAGRVAGFSHALQSAVGGELATLLAQGSLPGVRWLILVDALDEIATTELRTNVIDWIVREAQGESYRFVVASRPLAELDRFPTRRFGRYESQPFDDNQVTALARKSFASAPERADQFLRGLRARLPADLVRVPLLLTMAASVFARAGQATSSPQNRTELYISFVERVLAEDAAGGELQRLVEAWQSRSPTQGEQHARRLFELRQELIEDLALWRQDGNTGSLVDRAVCFVSERLRLPEADADWLSDQLSIVLTRTGLVKPGDNEFTHASFQEFLSASRLAKQFRPGQRASWRYVDRWSDPDPSWREVVLFLLAIWSRPRKTQSGTLESVDVSRVVQHIWRRQGRPVLDRLRHQETPRAAWHRAMFVGTALGEGAHVADASLKLAVLKTVVNYAHSLSPRELQRPLNAFRVLVAMGADPEAQIGLQALAAAPATDLWTRQAAIFELARWRSVDGLRAVDRKLTEAAGEPSTATWLRVQTALGLASLGQSLDQPDLLAEAIHNLRSLAGGAIEPWVRIQVTAALAHLAPAQARPDIAEHALATLLQLATDDALAERDRGAAVEALGVLRRVAELRALAVDQDLAPYVRMRAADALSSLARGNGDDPGVLDTATSVLREMTEHGSETVRVEAAAALGRLGLADRAAALLQASALGATTDQTRATAVNGLRDLERDAELRGLAANPAATGRVRVQAATALARLGRARGRSALVAQGLAELERLVDDRTSPWTCVEAAAQLGSFGRAVEKQDLVAKAEQALEDVAASTSAAAADRAHATEVLGWLAGLDSPGDA